MNAQDIQFRLTSRRAAKSPRTPVRRITTAALLSRVVLLCAATFGASASEAAPRDQIVIVGSSTVYPFSAIVAEHFAKSGPFPTPVVRSTSTADGFNQFCAGNGPETADISDASRRITADERATCAAHGVRRMTEVRIGYDSVVLASVATAPGFNVTLDQLWRATAKFVPIKDKFVANPYTHWREIAPMLPDLPIRLFGPAPGHGTRDTFVELVMKPSCKATTPGSKLPPEEFETVCSAIRSDGDWTDVANLELILGKLASHPGTMGLLTYSYLEEFPNRIRAATVEGVAPSTATIVSRAYPISRPLFIYVNEAHLKTTTGLSDYVAEFVSLCAAGAHGYLFDEGLVPMPMAELLGQRAAVARLQR